MKTRTGLTILHDGPTVNVYTVEEMSKLRDKGKILDSFKSLLGIK